MTVICALVVGFTIGLYTSTEVHKRCRAERNLARLQRDVAQADRDQALRNNVLVFDSKRLAKAMEAHPAGSRLPRQGQR